MKPNTHTAFKFYQALGKLFYAIAATDHRVNNYEFYTLKRYVKKYWSKPILMNSTIQLHPEAHIVHVFNGLKAEGRLNAETCYSDFINFKNAHNTLFTNQVKHLILKTAWGIARAFSDLNKSELILLTQLNMALKN